MSLTVFTKVAMAACGTTCSLDPLPLWIMKQLWPMLGPCILNLFNFSLLSGVFQICFKDTVIMYLSKRPGLAMLSNYSSYSIFV